jgi:hypothetical protein
MREQNEASFPLAMLADAVDRIREMLQLLAQPQRAAVARGLENGVSALEQAVTKLRRDIDENKTNG